MQKNIILVSICCVLGAVGLTWIGIESYPNLNRLSDYVGNGIFGCVLGYFFGIICVIVKAIWIANDGKDGMV
jgi:hypothetical protein